MRKNIRRVFLVDYENTSIRGLYGISCLRENTKVVVFCSSPVIQKSVDDILKIYQERGVETSTFILKKTGKNALDFMITTYLGFEINAAIDKEIYIISSDHGFESAIEMAKQLDPRMTVDYRRNIVEALPVDMRQGMTDIEESAGLLLSDHATPVLMLEEKKSDLSWDVDVIMPQKVVPAPTKPEKKPEKKAVVEKKSAPEKKSVAEKKAVPEKKLTEEKPATEKNEPKKGQKQNGVNSLLKAVMRKKPEPVKEEAAPIPEKKAVAKPVQKQVVSATTPNVKTITPVPVAVKADKHRVVVDADFVEVQSTPAPKAVLTKKQKNEARIHLISIMEQDNRIPQKYHINLAAALVNATMWEECQENVANILGPANKHLMGEMKELFDKERA